MAARPLNVPTTPARGQDNDGPGTTPKGNGIGNKAASVTPSDITSPHELTAFVETLLEQLDTKFDEMSTQILDRMTQMSTRVDALEASIQDIINGDVSSGYISVPPSPSVTPSSSAGFPSMKRAGSGA